MHIVIAHSSLHWLEPALLAIPALAVIVAIFRERGRRRATETKESS